MFGIFDKIEEFFKELLLGGIQANLESMFLDINDKVGAVATDVGKTLPTASISTTISCTLLADIHFA